MDYVYELEWLNRQFLSTTSAEEYAENWQRWVRLTRSPRSVTSLAPAGAGLYLLLRFFDWLKQHNSAAPRAEEGSHGEGAVGAVGAADRVHIVERRGH